MMPQNTTPTTHQNNLPPLDDDLKYLIDTIFNTPASPGELYNEMHLFLIHNKISSIAQLHAIGEHERKLWTYPVVQGYDSDGKSLPPLLKTLSSYHLGLFKTYEGYVLYRDMELDDQVDVYDFQNSVSRDEFIRYAASAHLIFFVNNQLPWQIPNKPKPTPKPQPPFNSVQHQKDPYKCKPTTSLPSVDKPINPPPIHFRQTTNSLPQLNKNQILLCTEL